MTVKNLFCCSALGYLVNHTLSVADNFLQSASITYFSIELSYILSQQIIDNIYTIVRINCCMQINVLYIVIFPNVMDITDDTCNKKIYKITYNEFSIFF